MNYVLTAALGSTGSSAVIWNQGLVVAAAMALVIGAIAAVRPRRIWGVLALLPLFVLTIFGLVLHDLPWWARAAAVITGVAGGRAFWSRSRDRREVASTDGQSSNV